MKLILVFILSTAFAFAQNIKLKEFELEKCSEQNVEQINKHEQRKSKRFKRKSKGLKRILNKISHDIQTEKGAFTPEKKERRRFKVLSFLEKIKNAIGPVKVKSMETENPNLLLFEVTGKTRHFKFHSAKFAVGEITEGLDWAREGQVIGIEEL